MSFLVVKYIWPNQVLWITVKRSRDSLLRYFKDASDFWIFSCTLNSQFFGSLPSEQNTCLVWAIIFGMLRSGIIHGMHLLLVVL